MLHFALNYLILPVIVRKCESICLEYAKKHGCDVRSAFNYLVWLFFDEQSTHFYLIIVGYLERSLLDKIVKEVWVHEESSHKGVLLLYITVHQTL